MSESEGEEEVGSEFASEYEGGSECDLDRDETDKGHDFSKLKTMITERSVEKDNWSKIASEWTLMEVFYEETHGNCACGRALKTRWCYFNPYTLQSITTGYVCAVQLDPNLSERKISGKYKFPCVLASNIRKLILDEGDRNAALSVRQLARRINILTDDDIDTYSSMSDGKGGRMRFDEDNDAYEPTAVALRRSLNARIVAGFRRRPFCNCKKRPTLAVPRVYPETGRLWYGCKRYTRGVRPGCGFVQLLEWPWHRLKPDPIPWSPRRIFRLPETPAHKKK